MQQSKFCLIEKIEKIGYLLWKRQAERHLPSPWAAVMEVPQGEIWGWGPYQELFSHHVSTGFPAASNSTAVLAFRYKMA